MNHKIVAAMTLTGLGLVALTGCLPADGPAGSGPAGSDSASQSSVQGSGSGEPAGTGGTGGPAPADSEGIDFSFSRSAAGPEASIRVSIPEELLSRMSGPDKETSYEDSRVVEAYTITSFPVSDELLDATSYDCGIHISIEWAEGGLDIVRDAVISRSKHGLTSEVVNVASATGIAADSTVTEGASIDGFTQYGMGTWMNDDLDEAIVLRRCSSSPFKGGLTLGFPVYTTVGGGSETYDNDGDGEPDREFRNRAHFDTQSDAHGSVYVSDAKIVGFHKNDAGRWVG